MTELFDPKFFGTAFVTLFVIMDPPGTIPIFLGLTSNMSKRDRGRAATQAVAVSFGVITLFALFGRSILNYLGISLPALQCAGGLLLLLVALELLTGKAEGPQGRDDVNISFVPLGTPLLAGPGAIVATIVFVEQAEGDTAELVALALAVLAVHVVLWLTMRFSGGILRVIGDNGVLLITRIAGLLLSAIAVQLVAESIFAFVEDGP